MTKNQIFFIWVIFHMSTLCQGCYCDESNIIHNENHERNYFLIPTISLLYCNYNESNVLSLLTLFCHNLEHWQWTYSVLLVPDRGNTMNRKWVWIPRDIDGFKSLSIAVNTLNCNWMELMTSAKNRVCFVRNLTCRLHGQTRLLYHSQYTLVMDLAVYSRLFASLLWCGSE